MSALIEFKPSSEMIVHPDDDNLTEIMALNDAIVLLNQAKLATCRMALPIFVKVSHAHQHLCRQLKELL